jgi:hypothetical protein
MEGTKDRLEEKESSAYTCFVRASAKLPMEEPITRHEEEIGTHGTSVTQVKVGG